LEGTILVKESAQRICGIAGTISYPVEFGLGLMGKVDEGGTVHIIRVRTASGNWQVSLLSLHIQGRMLLIESLSQDHEEARSDFRDIPPHLTLSQAAAITRPSHSEDRNARDRQ
jgi:hypothetical protein